MTSRQPGLTTPRRVPRILAAASLVVIAAAVGFRFLAPSSPTALSVTSSVTSTTLTTPRTSTTSPVDVLRSQHPGVLGEADGAVPDATTVFDSESGAIYALCQIYSNEPWHYELRPQAIRHGCPPMYADPTHDPRMQQ